MKYFFIIFSIILVFKILNTLFAFFNTKKNIRKSDILFKVPYYGDKIEMIIFDMILCVVTLLGSYILIKYNANLFLYEICIMAIISILPLESILISKFSKASITKKGIIYLGKLYTWNDILNHNIDISENKVIFVVKRYSICNYLKVIILKALPKDIERIQKIVEQNII